MIALPVTLVTASILGLMFIWLSTRVINGRVRGQVLIGEGTDDLQFRVRTHGNFCEYTPIFLILLALLELSSANQTVLIVLAALFVLARILHVPGMGADANLKFRQAGIIGSFASIVVASIYGLVLTLI